VILRLASKAHGHCRRKKALEWGIFTLSPEFIAARCGMYFLALATARAAGLRRQIKLLLRNCQGPYLIASTK
jgi:hypothetical protein